MVMLTARGGSSARAQGAAVHVYMQHAAAPSLLTTPPASRAVRNESILLPFADDIQQCTRAACFSRLAESRALRLCHKGSCIPSRVNRVLEASRGLVVARQVQCYDAVRAGCNPGLNVYRPLLVLAGSARSACTHLCCANDAQSFICTLTSRQTIGACLHPEAMSPTPEHGFESSDGQGRRLALSMTTAVTLSLSPVQRPRHPA